MKNAEKISVFLIGVITLVGVFWLTNFSFALMSKRSTLQNLGGFLILAVTVSVVVFFIFKKIKAK